MTLLKVLDSTDNGNIVTFEQWPSFLGKSNWKEIVGFESYPRPTEKSLNVQYIMSVVILHELMHSVGIPSPIGIIPLFISYVFSLDAKNGI